MRIAHIAPPPWAGIYPRGDYRMVLAHWALAYPEYAKILRKGGSYVLMDNGAFEMQQVSIDGLNRAAEACGADEVILPDVQGEAKETLVQSWEALGRLSTKRVMFVAHGRTVAELRGCLAAWMSRWEASTWRDDYALSLGVGSIQVQIKSEKGEKSKGNRPQVGSRKMVLQDAARYGYPMHLLGVCSLKEFAESELPLARDLGVRGVDTSSAFALGAQGYLLTPDTPKVRLKDPTEYKMLTTPHRRLIRLNTAILSEWVNTGATKLSTRLVRQVASRWLKYYAEGFADLADVMLTCGIPAGKYALLKENGREKYVRPLADNEVPRGKETLIVLEEIMK